MNSVFYLLRTIKLLLPTPVYNINMVDRSVGYKLRAIILILAWP